MITDIIMKDVATYRTSVKVGNLKRLNYFFGNNGSGKSTIAKYLQSLAMGDQENRYSSCQVANFNPTQEEILVFNREFIERNFKHSSTLKGVFSLNQKNAEIDEQIKANEEKITSILKTKPDIEEKKNKLVQQSNQIKTELIEKCFNKRNIFRSFSKIKLDYSGSKKNNLEKN